MTNSVKSELEKFFGNCEVISENKYRIHMGPSSAGYDLIFDLSGDNITVLNLISRVDDETIELIARKVFGTSQLIKYEVRDNSLKVFFMKAGRSDVSDVLGFIEEFFREFITSFPRKAWLILGELQFNLLGETITILSSKYNECLKTGWRGNIIAILREDNWIISNIGRDHVDLPVLTMTNGDIFAFAPNKYGDSLIPINLSEIIKELKTLVDALGISLIDVPKNEIELIHKFGSVISLIDSINMIDSEKRFSILTLNLEGKKLSELREIIRNLKEKLDAVGRLYTFDGMLRKKIALKLAVRFANELLSGESGVIVSNVRKVSRLGAGKAIYIGKEELKAIPLGEKVLVSVIEEKGRRKIVIEPI